MEWDRLYGDDQTRQSIQKHLSPRQWDGGGGRNHLNKDCRIGPQSLWAKFGTGATGCKSSHFNGTSCTYPRQIIMQHGSQYCILRCRGRVLHVCWVLWLQLDSGCMPGPTCMNKIRAQRSCPLTRIIFLPAVFWGGRALEGQCNHGFRSNVSKSS